VTNNEKIALFNAASKALNELRKLPLYGHLTQNYLEASLNKLHAAYGSELIAGLKPEEKGDTNAQR